MFLLSELALETRLPETSLDSGSLFTPCRSGDFLFLKRWRLGLQLFQGESEILYIYYGMFENPNVVIIVYPQNSISGNHLI
jgi:hypothetical protein